MRISPVFREEGFALLELMIAAGILTVVVLGSATMLIMSIKFNASSMEKITAVRLAKNKLDELRSLNYHHADLNIGTQSDPKDPLGGDENQGGIYTRKWSVSSGTTPGTKDVCVMVKWNRGEVMLSSLIADKG